MPGNKLKVMLMDSSNGKGIQSFLEESLKDFKEKEGIDIVFKFVSWNRAYETIIADYKNGDFCDVIQLGSTWINPLAYLGYIKPISNKIFKKAIPEWLNDYCNYKGKQVAVPWIVDPVIMTIRQKYLSKYNIVTDEIRKWEGFYQLISKLSDMREYDLTIPKPLILTTHPSIDTVHRLSAWLYAAGYNYPDLNQSSDYFLKGDKFLEIIHYLNRLVKASACTADDIDKHPYQLNQDFFSYDSIVFNIGYCYSVIDDLINKKAKTKYKVLPLPSPDGSIGTYSGATVFAISSGTSLPEKSLRFIQKFLSEDFTEAWQNYTHSIPAYESSFWQARFTNEEVNVLYKLVLNSKSYPVHPIWRSIESILSDSISQCLRQLYIDNDFKNIKRNISTIIEKGDNRIINLLNYLWDTN